MQQSIIATACAWYRWDEIDPHFLVADSVLGKFRREFQAHSLSTYPLDRLKSAAAAQVSSHETKRTRLADRLTLLVDDDGDEAEPSGQFTILEWLHNFEMLTISYAVVGCYAVPWPTAESATATCIYADQNEMDHYRREFTLEVPTLRKCFTETSVVKYLTAVEDGMRTEATKQARPPKKKPWSKALVGVVESKASLWTKLRNLLQERQQDRLKKHQRPLKMSQFEQVPPPLLQITNGEPQHGKGGNKGGNGGGGGKHNDKRQRDSPQGLVKEDKDGKRLCFAFNSSGGCSKKNCSFKHGCSVKLLNGHACAGNHPMTKHEDAKHGRRAAN